MLSSWLLTCAIFRASTLKPQCGTKCTSTAREPGMSQTTAEPSTSKGCKKCSRCGIEKPYEAFSPDRRRPDGCYSSCRECLRGRYKQRPELRLAQRRRWALKKQASNDPKFRARIALNNARRDGRIIRPDACSKCGCECIPHGHHTDYSKPLEVIWLCHPCHVEEHENVG